MNILSIEMPLTSNNAPHIVNDKALGGALVLGFTVCNVEPNVLMVSHLLFADVTLLFCEADSDHVLYLRYIFTWFAAASGLKVNLGK
jgi:hypothetical protein